jgi:hypothetical protein
MANNLIDPILNDVVYTLLYSTSYQEKRGLKGKYLRAAMSGEKAKRFCANSTREEKEYILSHFGIKFFYGFSKEGIGFQKIKDILAKFDSGKRVAAMKDIAEHGIFVTSDKEVVRALGLFAQSIHHHTFFLNLEFLRQGYHIQKWKKHSTNNQDMAVREADESAKLLAETMLNACITLDYAEGLLGITQTAMKLLLHLYTFSHAYIPDQTLYDRFAGAFNKTKYRYAIKSLIKDGLIVEHGPKVRKEITITAGGIKHVNNFMDSAMKLTTKM